MRSSRWLVLAALVAAGCGGSSGGSSDNGGGNGKPIKIGASLPLTGDFSEPGKAAQQGYQVWESMTNAKGGLLGRKVQIVIKDDASNQNTVVSDYNALISQDKVDLLLGTFSSLLNLPASTVAETNQMLYVEPAGGSPEIFKPRLQVHLLRPAGDRGPPGRRVRELASPACRPTSGPRRPPTRRSTTRSRRRPSQGIEAILEAAGIKTVYTKTYAGRHQELRLHRASVKSANPDLVVHGAHVRGRRRLRPARC